MKLQAQSSRDLLKALQKSAKCVGIKNALCILDHALLTTHADGTLFLTTSTGDAQLTIPAPLSIIDGKLSDPIALPISMIMPFIATLPDCAITMTLNESTHALHMEYCTGDGDKVKTGNVQLTYQDGKYYPLLKELAQDVTHISLPMSLVDTIIGNAGDFAHKNDLRPILECLCLDIADDFSELAFVGTDQQRLYRVTHSNDPKVGGSDFFRGGKSTRMFINFRYFRTLSVFEGCEMINIESDERTLRFTADDMELLCKCVEGKFPNYKAVIPNENPYKICFSKKEMQDILKRVGLFCDKQSLAISLKKDGMFLKVKAKDIDFAVAAEDQVIIADSQCEEGFKIGFKIPFLSVCINAIPGDTIRMTFSAPSRAAIFTEDTPSPKVMTLCMPYLLDD